MLSSFLTNQILAKFVTMGIIEISRGIVSTVYCNLLIVQNAFSSENN